MALVYDPVKAHEYYLRTRHLKGRKSAAPKFSVSRNGKTTVLTQEQLTEQRTYAAHRVNNILNRLDELNKKLRELMDKAQKNVGETKSKPTAADKSQAARTAKQYRQKHQTEIAIKRKRTAATKPKQESPNKNTTVANLEKKIQQVKMNLKTAVAIQRSLDKATKIS